MGSQRSVGPQWLKGVVQRAFNGSHWSSAVRVQRSHERRLATQRAANSASHSGASGSRILGKRSRSVAARVLGQRVTLSTRSHPGSTPRRRRPLPDRPGRLRPVVHGMAEVLTPRVAAFTSRMPALAPMSRKVGSRRARHGRGGQRLVLRSLLGDDGQRLCARAPRDVHQAHDLAVGRLVLGLEEHDLLAARFEPLRQLARRAPRARPTRC